MTSLLSPPTTAPPVLHDVVAIVNPYASGIADAVRERAAVHRALAAAGADVTSVVTTSTGHLADVLATAGDRRVVLVGGDGVLHTVANLGLDTLPELALIPAGKANNIAHALGIPEEREAAAALAVGGAALGLDLLEVVTPARTLYGVEGVSAGFQAAARARYHAENSGAVLAGALALARTLLELPHFSTRLVLDGAPPRALDFEQLFLNTLPYFSFGLRVDPGADPRDGADEAIILHESSRHGVLGALLAARGGRHLARAGTEVLPWQTAELLDPVPLAVDGEPLGVTTARLRVLPSRLRVVAGSEV
jgi:diacylglycerol kinase family enzyme